MSLSRFTNSWGYAFVRYDYLKGAVFATARWYGRTITPRQDWPSAGSSSIRPVFRSGSSDHRSRPALTVSP